MALEPSTDFKRRYATSFPSSSHDRAVRLPARLDMFKKAAREADATRLTEPDGRMQLALVIGITRQGNEAGLIDRILRRA